MSLYFKTNVFVAMADVIIPFKNKGLLTIATKNCYYFIIVRYGKCVLSLYYRESRTIRYMFMYFSLDWSCLCACMMTMLAAGVRPRVIYIP